MKMNSIMICLAIAFVFASFISRAQTTDTSNVEQYVVSAFKKMNLSGYTELRYQQFQAPAKIDGFDIHRARLQLKGVISDHVNYYLQTDVMPGNALLLDATMAYSVCNGLKFTGGQMKLPFSQENLLDDSKLFTINRSQVVEALVARTKDVLGNQNGRDIGMIASGSLIKISEHNLIDYSVGVFNGQGINQPDLNSEKDFDGRLLIHPIKNLDIGGAVYTGYDNFGNLKSNHIRDRVGFDFGYSFKGFDVRVELIQGQDSLTHKQGYYIQGAYYIIDKKLQIVGKYDNYDPNVNPKKTNDQTTVITGALNYFITSNLWIKLDYENHKVQNNIGKNDLYIAELLIAF